MPQDATARHSLPNLIVSQSQKELTYNEALARIDALLHPAIEGQLTAPPTTLGEVDDGKCWLVQSPAMGAWIGKEGQIARWSGGSWRYLIPVEGMALWHVADAKRYFYINGIWITGGPIANPSGGTIVDVEARATLAAILDHLRQISSISS